MSVVESAIMWANNFHLAYVGQNNFKFFGFLFCLALSCPFARAALDFAFEFLCRHRDLVISIQ